MENLSGIILLVGLALGWIVVILVAWWLLFRRKLMTPRRVEGPRVDTTTGAVLLAIDVPKENDKTPLAAEALFSSLHGIGESRLSFEIEAKEKSIRFYVWVPLALRGYVESQLYAQYPNINIMEMRDYADPTKLPENLFAVATELKLGRSDLYPIKTFLNFDVDPLAAITSTLSKLEEHQHIWIQLIVWPEGNKWRDRAVRFINDVRTGNKRATFAKAVLKEIGLLMGEVVGTIFKGGTYQPTEKVAKPVELSAGMEQALKEVEAKSSKLGFSSTLRIIVLDRQPELAQSKLQLAVGAFKQFNTNNLNYFEVGQFVNDQAGILSAYSQRSPGVSNFILNVTELASIYHLPNVSVTTPNIVWAGSKKGEPPSNLPLEASIQSTELTLLAKTNFRGSEEKFGIKLKDRRRHVYVIGKSGVGKSVLLKNMAIDDIRENRGVAMIDPHGEDVTDVLDFIPNYRVNDVIVFDPGDRDFAVGFNMFELADPKYKVVTASGIVGSFKNLFADSWGPRLEYWLKSAVLALMDYPNATLLMVPRIFTDKEFRGKVLESIQDPMIKSRWTNEWPKLDPKAQGEAIGPILNKVGQFLSSPVIRNIVGQPKSSIDFRKVMDEGKILLVKLSKGIIGDDNSNLLGSMIVTQFQLAAMSRADIPPSERRDFYLYVDEFQNFATDSFATILSEARKYNLSLTVANQYMAQLSDEVKNAIFGNVGTLISFRVGADDADGLMKEFAPIFDANDLVNLNIYNIYLKLSVDGMTMPAFSAQTLPPPADHNHNTEKIIALSHERYTKPAIFVEEKIKELLEETAAGSAYVPRGETPSRSYGNSSGYTSNSGGSRPLPNRPVPFRPALKVDLPGATDMKTAIQSAQTEVVVPPVPSQAREPRREVKRVYPRGRVKPQEATLKNLISAIEKNKPKSNLIHDLQASGTKPGSTPPPLAPKANELKENEWISLENLKKQSDKNQPPQQ
ncbi:MAG: TraM recognition domain-containing protein [Patescibacteria group bacterium]|jgi:hypothetical protein